jgi:hypothetical protein
MHLRRAFRVVGLPCLALAGVIVSGCSSGSGETVGTSGQAVTVPTYTFAVPDFEIYNTRSWHTDTDYVTASVIVNNNVVGTQQVFMGDLNNGTYNPGISIGPVGIGPSDQVKFLVNITNRGFDSATASDVNDLLTLVGAGAGFALNVALDDQSTDYGSICETILTSIFGVLFPDCDGVVASPAVGVTGDWLAANPWVVQRVNSPGTNSPTGCGSNSVYAETLKITQTGASPPPPPPSGCGPGLMSCCGGDLCRVSCRGLICP